VRILKAIGKWIYYLGKGLWWFCRAVGRDIERSYHRHQEEQRIKAIRQRELARIEEDNRVAGIGWAQGVAEVRRQERVRRQDERDQKEYWNRLNKMYEVPHVNEDVFFGDGSNKRRKKKSIWDY